MQKVTRNLARIRNLRRALARNRLDVLLSFIDRTNILALLGSRGLGVPVVVSERVDPASHEVGWIWNMLRTLTYPLADGLVVQVPSIRAFFPWWLQGRISVIPNPVPRPPGGPPAGEPRPRILAAGRLTPQKGFDLLLEAFARVSPGHPEWRLDILGEGEARGALEALVAHHGLQGRCRLMGNRPDIHAQMRGADLFVLSSRAEGFPNVLCEAMAAGMAVVSFDCPTGPAQILRPGVDGLLVPAGDVGGLAEAMARLMDDPVLRARLASRAPDVLARFDEQAVLAQWDACLRAACGPDSARC